MANHLPNLENEGKCLEDLEIDDSFPDEQVFIATHDLVLWYANFSNYVVSDTIPDNLIFHQRKKFLHKGKRYFLNEPYLFRCCANNIIKRYIT